MPESAIVQAKSRAVDSINTGFAAIAIIAVPLSLARIPTTGWMPIYTVHLILGLAVVSLWIFKAHLAFNARFWGTIAVMWAVGIGGLLSFGIMGAGIWWLVMSALISGMIKSPSYCVGIMAGALAVVSAVGGGYIGGGLSLGFDANVYAHAPSSWLLYTVAAILLPLVVFTAFSTQFSLVSRAVVDTALERDDYKQQADVDPLSGAKRPHIFAASVAFALSQLRRGDRVVAVVFLDVDNFKPINDKYGHAAGDAVIVEVARRLRSLLREEDLVARLGGDEFAVLLAGVNEPRDVARIANHIVALGDDVHSYRGCDIGLSFSVGVTHTKSAGVSAEEMIRHADAAMYEAKRAGGGRCNVTDMDGHNVLALRAG